MTHITSLGFSCYKTLLKGNCLNKYFIKSNQLNKIIRYLNIDCSSSLNINILKEYIEEDAIKTRVLGINTKIDFYDTHRLNKRIKYLQNSLKTILILPSTIHSYNTYSYFIDKLFEKFNYRILTLNFPGIYVFKFTLF